MQGMGGPMNRQGGGMSQPNQFGVPGAPPQMGGPRQIGGQQAPGGGGDMMQPMINSMFGGGQGGAMLLERVT